MNEAKKTVATGSAPVAKKTFPRHWKSASAAMLAFGLIVGGSAADNREHEDQDIWFVHATDPHIFVKPEEAREEQQTHNRKALSDMLGCIGSLPDGEKPEFLVLTGDLGIDPCDIPNSQDTPSAAPNSTPSPQAETSNGDEQEKKDNRSAEECVNAAANSAWRTTQIKETGDRLGKSPIQNIYLVAGNNDIARESAGDDALKYFNDFIKDVQDKLNENKGNKVQLHNLTRCYAAGEDLATCYEDIPNTPYRLIGFPSYSFKKKDASAQAKHMKIFEQLLEGAKDRKVLIATHTPAMDDPYSLGRFRYLNPKGTTAETTAPAEMSTVEKKKVSAKTEGAGENEKEAGTVSTWDVDEKVRDAWKKVVDSDPVLAVLAGHLHDSHKEIYERPYTWSNDSKYRAAFDKLFLAPPLAIKKQDSSPIQARGFALVHLRGDRVESRLFWYDSETGTFTPDPKHKHRWGHDGFWRCLCQGSRAAIGWLWDLEKTDSALVRMAILLIAFVTAFLTIVATWQIPPGSDPFAEGKKPEDASKPAQAPPKASADSLPFSSRFGRTVIGGLGGLAAAEVTKTLGNEKPSADTRWYYIVWFILFFFLLLLSLNFVRAFVEALRARVAVIYYPPAKLGTNATLLARFSNWFRYWVIMRPGQWLGSLRVPLITFFDTFVNLIQGKNQTRTRVFEQRIIDQQRTILRVADATRTSLNRLIERRVQQHREHKPAQSGNESQPLPDQLERVRVNISVLSRYQTNVFYISKASNSSYSKFPKRSVAWASVFTGQPLWYLSDYRKVRSHFDKIILFEKEGTIPDERGPYRLQDYYQPRPQEDYGAFIILPVPFPRRGFTSDYVKGAIQISFREDNDFKAIWKSEAMKPGGDPPIYPAAQPILEDWCLHDDIRAALTNSIATLGELLRGFNEIIYKNYIESPPD